MKTGFSQDEQVQDAATNQVDRQRKHSAPTSTTDSGRTLSEVFQGVETTLPASANKLIIHKVACDSRKVQPGSLFFALHGAKADGNAFIRDAIKRGAVAIASEDKAPGRITGVTWIQVREARKALAITAANFLRHPANALQLVGVTGTNGKTTTTSVVDAIVKASGTKTGLFGTIAYHTPLGDYPAPNTTPESVDLQGFFAEIRDAGGKYAVLEASSHSLAMDRLWGCHFQAAVFTNLTREHMDFHKTFEDYFAAKKRLFAGTGAGAPEVAVLNGDDQFGKRLVGLAKKTVTYGLELDADITTKKFQLTFDGLTFTAQTPNGKVHVESRLVGRINVYNLLAAIGAAQALGLSNEVIESGIRNLESVSGRFQRIDLGQPFLVIVDYAHRRCLGKPDSNRARAESQGPDHHAVRLWRRKGPDQAAGDGRSHRQAQRSDNSFQRQSAQRRPAEDHQRHHRGAAENRRKISDRTGQREGHRHGHGRSPQWRHRIVGGKRPRELSDSRRQNV